MAILLFLSCKTHSLYKSEKNLIAKTTGIKMVVKENTLGYARVRGKSSFSVKDTSNVIAHIPCGTRIKVDIPVEFLKGGKRESVKPWYYSVIVKNEKNRDTSGYIVDEVLESYDQFEEDSLYEVECRIKGDCDEKNDGRIILEGKYNGKNLYVQNPFNSKGFCIYDCVVNGNVTTDTYESSAWEIDLTRYSLRIGDPVTIFIKHRTCCLPKILNPEVILPASTFSIVKMDITTTGRLTWITKKENGKLPFKIQQYVWNKWNVVGEVEGIGIAGENKYEFQLIPHSGENKVRVVQVDYTGRNRPSEILSFIDSSVHEVAFNPRSVLSQITFTNKTRYEIYDEDGNIIKKGFDRIIDCTGLKKGSYYLNYDNMTSTFVKN